MNWLNSFKNQNSALGDLTLTLLDSAYKCGQEFEDSIYDRFGKDSKEARISWVHVQYEFLFFFTHLVMRNAFSKLGNEKLVKLQKLLGSRLANSTTEAWFKEWPKDMQVGIKHDFYNNLNAAELDYSQCKGGLLIKEPPFSEDGLFNRLANNVARLSGNEGNPILTLRCQIVGLNIFNNINLDYLIERVGKEI